MQHTIRALAIASGALLMSHAALAADRDQGTLNDGATVRDVLAPGDTDVYRFSARAGSTVNVGFGPDTQGEFRPLLELFDASGTFLDDASSSRGASLVFEPDADGVYTLRAGDGNGSAGGAYTLSYEYRGAEPVSPDRQISLERNVWHMLMAPVETDATFRSVFGGALSTDAYFNEVDGGWAVYIWNPDQTDASGAVTGGYRQAELDEPVSSVPAAGSTVDRGQVGFWFLHLAAGDIQISVPDPVEFQQRRQQEPGSAEDGTGACPDDLLCLRQPLAASGGWTMTGIPALRPASVGELRFVTEGGTACTGRGCPLNEAGGEGLTRNVVYTYDDDSGEVRDYTSRTINRDSRIQPWQAFWAFAREETAGTRFSVSVPVGAVPRPPPPPSN